uniref:FERM and PDZ domain-containing protein 4 n=1 Tax=Parastrongyloides trichosuri TaxID=131310 RepID=A0A0N4Z749_PARTI
MEMKDDYYSENAKNKPNQCDMCVLEDQRLFYIDHSTKRSHWQPPKISWSCRLGLPYGWEEAMDVFGFPYYINHISKTVTYNDPRQGTSSDSSGYFDISNSQFPYKDIPSSCEHSITGSYTLNSDTSQPSTPPIGFGEKKIVNEIENTTMGKDTIEDKVEEKREVKLIKHPDIGFGFVAASQQPVIVQYVTPNGPSDGKLLPNDQICMVNNVNVFEMDKEDVVKMIREHNNEITLTVQQLPKKKKGNKKNYHVRFTDKIHVSNMKSNDFLEDIPNVMRVYLENGQTKSFKFDDQTTVQDIVNNICSKLLIKDSSRFVLSLENSLSLRASKLCLLRPSMKICDLSNSSYVTYTRCRFRIAFMPTDISTYQLNDQCGFDYLYYQCTNDVVGGRFSLEMRYEACMRLAALHLRQLAFDNGNVVGSQHISIHVMEKEYGLATFLPMILLENVKMKQIKKHLRLYLKKDEGNKRDSNNFSIVKKCIQSELGSDEFIEDADSICSLIENNNNCDVGKICKLKYVEIVSLLPSFSGRTYNVTFKQTQMDMILQINNVQGLLIRQQGNPGQPTISVSYDLIENIIVADDTEVLKLVLIELKNNCHPGLDFVIDKEYAEDLVYYIIGYSKVYHSKVIQCRYEKNISPSVLSNYGPPRFRSVHIVTPSDWNYSDAVDSNSKIMVNLINDPPDYDQAIKATTAYFNDMNVENKPDGNKMNEVIENNKKEEEKVKIENVTVEILHASSENVNDFVEESNEIVNEKSSNFNLKFNDSIRLHKKRHSIVSGNANLYSSNTSLNVSGEYGDRRSSTISFNINNIDLLKSHFSTQKANSTSTQLSASSIIDENYSRSTKVSPVRSAKYNSITTVRRTSINPYNHSSEKDISNGKIDGDMTCNENQNENTLLLSPASTNHSSLALRISLSDSSTINQTSKNHPIQLFTSQEQDTETEIIDLTRDINNASKDLESSL